MEQPSAIDYLAEALMLAEGCAFVERPDAHSWSALEGELGVVLPDSHKRFVSSFGTGMFGNDLFLQNPCAQGLARLSRSRLEEFRAEYSTLLDGLGPGYWRKLYPEKGGLVLIAETGFRVAFFLETGAPVNRLVVLHLGQCCRFDYKMGFAEFICRLYKRELNDEWSNGFRESIWPKPETRFFSPILSRRDLAHTSKFRRK